jgi:hypothetical protein
LSEGEEGRTEGKVQAFETIGKESSSEERKGESNNQ